MCSQELRANGGQSGDVTALEGLLLEAAAENRNDTVMRLCTNGVNPNTKDRDQRSALHFAASNGNVILLDYLLQSGSDPNAKDHFGSTPLDEALRLGNRIGRDQTVDRLRTAGAFDKNPNNVRQRTSNAVFALLFWECIMIILYGVFVRYTRSDTPTGLTPAYTDVAVVTYIGFGVFLSAPRRLGITAVASTMFVAALATQWAVLVNGFFDRVCVSLSFSFICLTCPC
jgi:hypothetical protein